MQPAGVLAVPHWLPALDSLREIGTRTPWFFNIGHSGILRAARPVFTQNG
jgi:hypothetical protein